MTKKKLFMRFLREEGFRPKVDEDDDIVFKCEGKSYYIEASESDESYFRLILPNFWQIDNPDEERHALVVMSEVNAEIKVAKIYQRRDSIHATVEMFIDPMEGFKLVFPRCLGCIQAAIAAFSEKMKVHFQSEIPRCDPFPNLLEDQSDEQNDED